MKLSICKVKWKSTKSKKWKIDDQTDWDSFAKAVEGGIENYGLSMDIKDKYRVIAESLCAAGEAKIGYRKTGGGHRKFTPSCKLAELMSEQQTAFDEWSLAFGREDGSFDNQFATLTRLQNYTHITNEIKLLWNRELSESRKSLSSLIKKGNRSSSLDRGKSQT